MKPIKNKIIDDDIKSNINPHNIVNNKWPDNMFAPNLNPKLTLRAKFDIPSINTNNGTNGNEQPDGTNNPKYFKLWFANPITVTPIHNVTLNDTTNINWLLTAKLYGIIDIILANNINTNNEYINGKNCVPFGPIWFITIFCIVEYNASTDIFQLVDTNLPFFNVNTLIK